MEGNDKNLKLKNLVIKANSIFSQFRNWNHPSNSYNTYDLYTALDFPLEINYSDYIQKFRRQDIANRVVKAPIQGTWKTDPIIYESKETSTPFEEN